jgi:bleomycin hydrolase
MKKHLIFAVCLFSALSSFAQNKDKAKLVEIPQGAGFYAQTILKDVQHVSDSIEKKEPAYRFVMDQSASKLPAKVDLYKRCWANAPLSQGNAGTCWDFSTLSFYESEIFRSTGKKVKLSEMYIAYWEYLEKAARFVDERGNSFFGEGSEGNAPARIVKKYGLMPAAEFTGLINGHKYHTHAAMFAEMENYLKSVKANNAWDKEAVLGTIRSILTHYLGVFPSKFVVDGKEYTPQSYAKDYLKFNPENFVEILSLKQKPFWQQVEYVVDDNWWHSADYYNVPLEDYMAIIKKAIRNGYTMGIGGDVSEAGLVRETQCAVVPDFDIPSAYINDDARAFRFANNTTTDDHGMHLIGYVENYNGDGKDWFLIKDSSSGSRNNDTKAAEFGYYFFSEDYIKLKMINITVARDAVKDVLKKFEK